MKKTERTIKIDHIIGPLQCLKAPMKKLLDKIEEPQDASALETSPNPNLNIDLLNCSSPYSNQ